MKTKPPCELVVSKILPGIRASLVSELSENYELSQGEVSELVGITQPAVSQYLSQNRGMDEELKEFFPEIAEFAKRAAEQLVKGEIEPGMVNVCEPCREIREKEEFCDIHQEFSKLSPHCEMCEMRKR